ncbi:MAG: hypothetical protein JXB46_11310 [Candidatus Eisenbacteria bacterium]|nr:hypothetical protein [Candidatus Eisenbacteria bacterium]
MNWEATGAVAAIASSVAVIVSLVYLAVQIRQNTRATRASTYQSVVMHGGAMLRSLMEHPELADLLLKGGESLANLTPAEAVRFASFASSVSRNFDSLYYRARRGTLERGQWAGFDSFLREVLESRGLVEWWQAHKHVFDGEFASHVDGILSETRASDSAAA